MKNKIAYYIPNWTIGGVENVITNTILSENMNIWKKTIVIGNIVDDYYLEEMRQHNTTVIDLEAPRLNKIARYLYDINRIKEIQMSQEFDLWHINTNNCYGLFFANMLKKMGCKVVVHSHNSGFGGNGLAKGIMTKIIQKRYSNASCDFFVGCSADAIQFAFGKKLKMPQYVLKNGINCEEFEFDYQARMTIRQELSIKESDIVLGHIGHFNFQKNQKFIIDLISKLSDEYKAVLIGDGETKEAVVSYSKEKAVYNRCVFLPATTKVNKYYSAFDCFVFPSVFEGFGIVSIEAQVSGLKTIVSDRLPDTILVTGNAKKYSLDDISKWIEEIETINQPIQRYSYINEISKAGYNVSTMGKDLSMIYMNLLK